jgi:hypothetical protein
MGMGVRLVGMIMILVMAVIVIVIARLLVCRAFVDAEMDSFDLLPLRAVEVHVEISEVQLGEFPLQCGRLHAEIAKRADKHVAADSREAVKVEDFHLAGLWKAGSAERDEIG